MRGYVVTLTLQHGSKDEKLVIRIRQERWEAPTKESAVKAFEWLESVAQGLALVGGLLLERQPAIFEELPADVQAAILYAEGRTSHGGEAQPL